MTPMPKAHTWKSRKYRQWVSDMPCMVCGSAPPSDPHHVVIPGNSGMGQKPSDFWCVPLCHEHHTELHSQGRDTFERKYQISLPFLVMKICQGWIKKTS